MIRGLEQKHEHAAQRVARDTRPLGTRVAEFLGMPHTIFVIGLTTVANVILFPAVADVLFFIVLVYFLFLRTRQNTLPFRIPKSANAKDYNDLIPGTSRPKTGGGISFFGNDRTNGEEVWFTNDDMRTHVLIFGSTGSGKTEALVSIAFNSLVQGSGFIYIDGKGDNSLFAKVFSMVRGMGRDDDMLLINFMTGARDVIGAQKTRLSNTMNPFSSGSSSMISQLVTSLMDSGGQGGSSGGDMWKGRAINFVESLMKLLCAMRDAGHILMDANTIRDYFILEKLEMMVVDKKFPVTDEYSVPLDDYPPQIMEPLKNYVLNLPGYNPKSKGDQASEVREQHGFITMQLTRVFGSLADTYGHILRTNLAEVDLKDVVLNRRILVVLLPALEKSPDELANLGKIIIASLKAMMAAGLGDAVEGDYRDVILRKPTNAPSPYVCIMDEYGYYAVQGFAVVPAQARSLGFSAIFAGQDLPAFQKASKEEAASIGANCNVKICMKLEDPQETWEFFNKVAGETYVTNVSGFQVNSGSMSMNYMDSRNASVDRRQRVELLDLKDQREGEAHIFFKSKIIRAEMFYANPRPVKKMRIGHFLKVEPPAQQDLENMIKRLDKFSKVFTEDKYQEPELPFNEDISIITDAFLEADDYLPFERGISALVTLLEHEVSKQKEISDTCEMDDPVDFMSAFTRIPVSEIVQQMIGEENTELFNLPLLRKGSTSEEIRHIERLSGSTDDKAQSVSREIIRDIEKVTTYPPEVLFAKDKEKTLQDIKNVIKILGGEYVPSSSDDDLDLDFNFDDLPDLPDLPDDEESDSTDGSSGESEEDIKDEDDGDSETDFGLGDDFDDAEEVVEEEKENVSGEIDVDTDTDDHLGLDDELDLDQLDLDDAADTGTEPDTEEPDTDFDDDDSESDKLELEHEADEAGNLDENDKLAEDDIGDVEDIEEIAEGDIIADVGIVDADTDEQDVDVDLNVSGADASGSLDELLEEGKDKELQKIKNKKKEAINMLDDIDELPELPDLAELEKLLKELEEDEDSADDDGSEEPNDDDNGAKDKGDD